MKRFKLFCIIVAVAFAAVLIMSSCTSQSEKNELIGEGREIGWAQGVAFGSDSVKSSLYCINVTAYDKNDSIILIDEHYVCADSKDAVVLLECDYANEVQKFAMVDTVITNHWKIQLEGK